MTCKLCEINKADKKNSHIIPKFLGKDLFEETKPRHSIRINAEGKHKKIQDTVKEDYIFCASCEDRISYIETYLAKFFNKINDIKKFQAKFNVIHKNGQKYLETNEVESIAYKMFVFSIIWRCSISNSEIFNKFKLPTEVEEELRAFLNANLQESHKANKAHFKTVIKHPNYHNCIVKPDTKSRGVFSAYQMSRNGYVLFVVNYAIFFFVDSAIQVAFQECSNIGNDKITIFVGNTQSWDELNKLSISKMLKNNGT